MTQNQDLSPVLGGYFLQITDTCIFTFEDDKIAYLNEAACKLLEREEKDLIGVDVGILFAGDEKDTFLQKMNSTHERTDYFFIQMHTSSGAAIELKARLVPLILNDKKIIMMEAYNEAPLLALKKKNMLLEEKVTHLSPLDLETHLPSPILFNDRIEQGILRALREARGDLSNIQSYLTVMIGAIDGLDDVAKQFGIEGKRYVTDVLISRFKSSIRSVDTLAKAPDNAFYFLFENIRDKQNIRIITDRLQNCINVPILYKNETIKLTMKLGVSIYPDNGTSAVALIKWARLNPIEEQNLPQGQAADQ